MDAVKRHTGNCIPVRENAIEVIQSVTTAMAAGVDAATLAHVRFAYPTHRAIIGIGVRRLLQVNALAGELNWRAI
ncbi:hypothetical protein ACMT9Y_14680 [Clavibacter tessellarius]|uniref:hypothetical protein n=1 Tax=Clavibacter tessellarius TaxID=31965 RepID=UPI0039EA04AC